MRPSLCEEALRLGRILAGLVPGEPEVQGLVALVEIQASRIAARVGAHGQPVLLLDQDRGRWDPLLIRRGLAALERAEASLLRLFESVLLARKAHSSRKALAMLSATGFVR